MGKTRLKAMNRKDIQDKVHFSQAFTSYKSANDQLKEEYYFSRNLNCEANGEKIDSDSLFSHSVMALKIKQTLDGLIEIRYDLHILLVGTVLQPLMLSVSAINSDNILLLYDLQGTAQKKDALKDYIAAFKSKIAMSVAVNSSEPHTVFTAIKEIIEKKEWNEKKICIDITGGKKSMVGGGFLASSILGIDTYYIDFEQYINGNPVLCTEFLNKLDNPYDIYNIQLLNQAKELFRSYNYQAAFQLFSLIDSKLSSNGIISSALYGLEDEREKVAKMKLASEIYMYWDKFDYADAKDIGCQDFKNIAIVKSLVLPENIKSIYEVDDQFEYVKKICADRYANADRRYNQGRYEDALTRYSQSLEMACKSYLIHVIVSEKLSVQFSEKENDKKVNTQLISYDDWVEWKIDYASIAGIISWILCIQNLNWKNDNGFYSLTKLNDSEVKWAIIKKLFIDESLSNNKQKDKIKVYTDLIEHRNDFIHVSSLAAKKEKVDKFRDFVYTVIESIYVSIDMNDYKFSREFNHDGSL